MDVMGLGTYAMDIVVQVDALPGADGFCVVNQTSRLPGGSGTNVIVQLARLNNRCGYMAKVGDDQVGMEVEASLRSEGVDASTLVKKAGGVSLYTEIVVDAHGDKFIMLNMGTACLEYQPEEVDVEALARAKVFYTDLIPGPAAAAALQAARERGVLTALNMQVGLPTMEGLGISRQAILDSLQWADVFAPCRDGLYAITGTKDPRACLEYLRPYFKGVLLLTLGAEGSVAFDEQDRETRLPCRRIEPVDTTGAGDSYMGAFIDAYLLKKRSLRDAMSFATDCAAYTCCAVGARSCPGRKELEQWLTGSQR